MAIARTKAEMQANMQDILQSRKAPGTIIRTVQQFKSPVDGKIIRTKAELDEHNKRNDVIDVREWGNDSFCDLDAKKEREAFYSGTSTIQKKERVQTIKESIQKLEQGYIPPKLVSEDAPLK